ncbi:MAG: PilZ domain-containing protein [Rubrivivax sp.]
MGTLTIVRDGVFGFPMQTAFNIASVRAKGGRIAEISALAIHPRFRRTSGTILFPLMKFMHEYCTRYFDTRHLVIAVHPSHIDMYESLLFFRRLTAETVANYDFVNGAPAIGATLDLVEAPRLFERGYGKRRGSRDLNQYFFHTTLPEIQIPDRQWHASNDPVLTPELMDHFFNHRTAAFQEMGQRHRALLHSVYPETEWSACLPPLQPENPDKASLRRFPRSSFQCQAKLAWLGRFGGCAATIIEISREGFAARADKPLQVGDRFEVIATLGVDRQSRLQAQVVRVDAGTHGCQYGFQILESDAVWQHCIDWLEARDTPSSSHCDAAAAALQRAAVGAPTNSRRSLTNALTIVESAT